MSRLAVAALCVAFAGCGDADERNKGGQVPSVAQRSVPDPAVARPPVARPAPLEPARCPAGAANCASATGRVIYVERVDPDGDGDAHFVLAGGAVTGPGLSVIDVRNDLRPNPLPRAGDLVTAAGPVYRGSYGQRQIEAREVRVRRR